MKCMFAWMTRYPSSRCRLCADAGLRLSLSQTCPAGPMCKTVGTLAEKAASGDFALTGVHGHHRSTAEVSFQGDRDLAKIIGVKHDLQMLCLKSMVRGR